MRTCAQNAPLERHSGGHVHADVRLHACSGLHLRISVEQHEGAGSRPRIARFFGRYRPEVVSRGPGNTAADLHIPAPWDIVPDIHLRHRRPRHGDRGTYKAERGQSDANAHQAANHFATTLSSTPPVPPAFGTTTILL